MKLPCHPALAHPCVQQLPSHIINSLLCAFMWFIEGWMSSECAECECCYLTVAILPSSKENSSLPWLLRSFLLPTADLLCDDWWVANDPCGRFHLCLVMINEKLRYPRKIRILGLIAQLSFTVQLLLVSIMLWFCRLPLSLWISEHKIWQLLGGRGGCRLLWVWGCSAGSWYVSADCT